MRSPSLIIVSKSFNYLWLIASVPHPNHVCLPARGMRAMPSGEDEDILRGRLAACVCGVCKGYVGGGRLSKEIDRKSIYKQTAR